MRKATLAAVSTLALAIGLAGSANAALTATAAVGGGALTGPGITYENFDSLVAGSAGSATIGALTITFNQLPVPPPGDETGKAVQGSLPNVYAAPVLSGANGNNFGPGGTNQALGPDSTVYITSGSTTGSPDSNFNLFFANPINYVGLLWGSVDTYNTLTFYNGNSVVGTFTGIQILPPANGSQFPGGTAYVNIISDTPFTRITGSSSNYAFEVDNLAYGAVAVPEPGTLALLGGSLLGLGLLRRRRAAA